MPPLLSLSPNLFLLPPPLPRSCNSGHTGLLAVHSVCQAPSYLRSSWGHGSSCSAYVPSTHLRGMPPPLLLTWSYQELPQPPCGMSKSCSHQSLSSLHGWILLRSLLSSQGEMQVSWGQGLSLVHCWIPSGCINPGPEEVLDKFL